MSSPFSFDRYGKPFTRVFGYYALQQQSLAGSQYHY